MDWQLVASYCTVKSTGLFLQCVLYFLTFQCLLSKPTGI